MSDEIQLVQRVHNKINCIDIRKLTDQELKTAKYHFSLKKDEESIAREGLKSGIGEHSIGIEKEEAIYFSYGIEGVLKLWDFWLKWRLDRLFNPYYQDDNLEIIDLFNKGKRDKDRSADLENEHQRWQEEFICGDYKKDKDKMRILFEFQLAEMLASNYYLIELDEGEDFSSKEIDRKKLENMSYHKDSGRSCISYQVFKKMYGKYSDIEKPQVEDWNMNTFYGRTTTISPDKIKHLILPERKDSVLSIVLFLYAKYKEITHKSDQIEFDLLDEFIRFVYKKRELQIIERALIRYFHSQKDIKDFNTDITKVKYRNSHETDLRRYPHIKDPIYYIEEKYRLNSGSEVNY